MNEDAAIKVTGVSKDFVLPHNRKNSVKRIFTGLFSNNEGDDELQHALRGIDFEVKKGEFFGIVGRNGSGKSTLLKILAGIYQPTHGKVYTAGKLVPFIELGVGFNPELTGRENVFLNGAMLGFTQKEVELMYDDIVAFAELEEFMDQKLKNYSSGMQVRLAFSKATRAEADILLVDEVLAVGDADFQRKCYDYFKSLKNNKKTVIFVTHDMNAVKEYCDRAMLIDDGVIAHEGNSEKVSNDYLKLFNTNSTDSSVQMNSDRWGNGQIIVERISVKQQRDMLILTAGLRADKRGADDYVFGYKFFNSEGKLILGGNSQNATGGKRLSLEPNKKTQIKFSMPNVLGGGTYRVGFTLRLSDKVTICDDWSSAASFSVSKSESYYPVIAPATMEVL